MCLVRLQFMTCFSIGNIWGPLLWRAPTLIVITGWFPQFSLNAWDILGEAGAFWVCLLNLIKQWDQWGELRLELTQPYRGLFMPLLKSMGPRVSMHHTQENTRQLPDSPGPSSPPLNPSLLTVYKEHIAWLEPLSKSFRSHCKAPHFLFSLRREM